MDGRGMDDLTAQLKNGELSSLSMTTHEDNVRIMEERVFAQSIPWEGFQRANLIEAKELELIKNYDRKTQEVRYALLTKEGPTYTELFLDLLVKLNKEETLQYLLTVIDQAIREFPDVVGLLLARNQTNSTYPMDPLIRILHKSDLDWYTNFKAISIVVTLLSAKNSVFNNDTAVFVCQWLRNQLRRPDEKDQANAVIASMRLLQKENYRQIYAKEENSTISCTVKDQKQKHTVIISGDELLMVIIL